MKARTWLPPVVFIATAVPTVMLLHAFEVGGDFRLLIAIVVGVVATAIAQSRLSRRNDEG